MQHNGKALHELAAVSNGTGASPQGAGVLPQESGVSSQESGALSQSAGMLPQGAGTPMQGVALPMQPAARPKQRRVTGFSSKASIAQRLATAQIAIDSVLSDPNLQTLLAAYGYDAARMRQGQALREQALALYQQQRAASGNLYAATDARAAAQIQAHTGYMRHIKIARVALRDERGAMQKLGLAAPRRRAEADWLLQAQQFYTNALGDRAILARLALYGMTLEQLAAGQQQVAEVAAAAVTRQTQKGGAQETTRLRDAALAALNHWMRDFVAIARVALEGQPQRLEQLGLVVAS